MLQHLQDVEEASTGCWEGMMICWMDYSAYKVLVMISIIYISVPRSPPRTRATCCGEVTNLRTSLSIYASSFSIQNRSFPFWWTRTQGDILEKPEANQLAHRWTPGMKWIDAALLKARSDENPESLQQSRAPPNDCPAQSNLALLP